MAPPDSDREWEVDYIRDRRIRLGRVEYLVKWTGYPVAASTWQDEEDLKCSNLIQQFEKRYLEEKKANQTQALALPTKVMSHKVSGGTLSFLLSFSDGSTIWVSARDAKRKSITILLEYLEGITAFPVRGPCNIQVEQ
jgi:hypothetical protein